MIQMPCKGEFDTKIDSSDWWNFKGESGKMAKTVTLLKVHFHMFNCSDDYRLSAIDGRVIHFLSNEIWRKKLALERKKSSRVISCDVKAFHDAEASFT